MLRGIFITPIRVSFCIGSLKGIPLFFRGEDFLGFFPEPFLGAIATAAAITAIVTVIAPFVIITAAITAIGGTFTRVKTFPFGETFQKVNASTSL